MKFFGSIFILLLVVATNNAIACSCIGEGTTKQAVKNADIVFAGVVIDVEKVTEIDTIEIGNSKSVFTLSYYIYTLKIETVYKRKRRKYLKDTVVKIRTGMGSGDCGFHFQQNHKYIVYANTAEKRYLFTTNICTRTQAFNKEEIEELEKVTK